MERLRKVKLLGAAGRKFGREFEIAISSPAEAFRALCALCPELRGWVLQQHDKGVAWRVVTDRAEGTAEDELTMETGATTIVFAPQVQGSGGGGFGQIVAGVALIAVALFVPAAVFGLTSMLGVGLLGGALVLGGIAQLLTPTPVLKEQRKTGEQGSTELESNLFTRNSGNGAQGEVVPVLYGQRRIPAPRVVSFDLRLLPKSRQVTVAGTNGLLGYVNQQDL